MSDPQIISKTENPLHHNAYRPLEEELLVRPLTRPLARFLVETFPAISIELISFVGFAIQLLAAYEIYVGNFIFAAFFVYVAFIFDKLDGDLARTKAEKGIKVNYAAGTFFDGMLDIVGITLLTIAVVLVSPSHPIISSFAIAGPLLYWYTNAGFCAYLAPPTAPPLKQASLLKQIISYSKSKEVIAQILCLLTAQLYIYLVFHALVFFYTLLLFGKKIRKEFK